MGVWSCDLEDCARCRAEMGLAGARWRLGGSEDTCADLQGAGRGGLHQGSGDRGRDVDRTAGWVGAVFTGLGDRWGMERASTMSSIASSPGGQVDDTGGGAEPRRIARGLPLPRRTAPSPPSRLPDCPQTLGPAREVQRPGRTCNWTCVPVLSLFNLDLP